METQRLATFFGKTRLASITRMWIPNVRKHSAKQQTPPSSILKQYERMPWLVPLAVYLCCCPSGPGRLGMRSSFGYKIPGFLVALLLQQQAASVEAGGKENDSLILTRCMCLHWIKKKKKKSRWKSVAEHGCREVPSVANTHKNKRKLIWQEQLEFSPRECTFLVPCSKILFACSFVKTGCMPKERAENI